MTKDITKIILPLALVFSLSTYSQLDSVLETNKERTTAATASQAKIDSTQIKTDKASTEYKSVSKQIEGLKVYNAQKRKQIKRQKERMEEIEKTMKYASVLQRQIPPLARRMHAGLEQFVALDLPFNSGERAERMKFIKDALDNPTVSPAEKLRQVLEGFNIEAEYGRKIDTYKDTVLIDDQERDVNILRAPASTLQCNFPSALQRNSRARANFWIRLALSTRWSPCSSFVSCSSSMVFLPISLCSGMIGSESLSTS